MEKIKQYKFAILIILIILGFLFYWYEWRPRQIKNKCNDEAKTQAQELYNQEHSSNLWIIERERGTYSASQYENFYQECIRRKGL